MKISLENDPLIGLLREFLAPHTGRAYLVGGGVRDLLAGRGLGDYDVELYGVGAEAFFALGQELAEQLKERGWGAGEGGVLDEHFFVFKFHNLDLSLARIEKKVGLGHRGFELLLCDDERAGATRRDYSINSMMINIFSGELLDFYGGREDLAAGILRHIDDNFADDALRVLRGIVFAARFDFCIHPQTLILMKKMDLNELSRERINEELYKFFSSKYLARGLEYIWQLGIEKFLFTFDSKKTGQGRAEDLVMLLKRTRNFVNDEGLFLYLYLNFFGLDKEEFFAKTRLKKELLNKAKQDFFESEIRDLDLLKIALKCPLKNWLGLWDEARINRAKKLKIYDKKLKIKVQNEDLLTRGFRGRKLAEKIKNEKEKELKNYLKNFKEG